MNCKSEKKSKVRNFKLKYKKMAYYKNKSQGSKQVSRTSIVILENKNKK